MIKELLTRDTIRFEEGAESWEDAIRLGAEPLIDLGVVDKGYIDDIIANVHKHGPYIVICPGFALSHARSEHVHAVGMSYLRLGEPVNILDRADRSAHVILTLAACDNSSHLQAMRDLSRVLKKDDFLKRFLNCQTPECVLDIINDALD